MVHEVFRNCAASFAKCPIISGYWKSTIVGLDCHGFIEDNTVHIGIVIHQLSFLVGAWRQSKQPFGRGEC